MRMTTIAVLMCGGLTAFTDVRADGDVSNAKLDERASLSVSPVKSGEDDFTGRPSGGSAYRLHEDSSSSGAPSAVYAPQKATEDGFTQPVEARPAR